VGEKAKGRSGGKGGKKRARESEGEGGATLQGTPKDKGKKKAKRSVG
jgi:hypothetical protein